MKSWFLGQGFPLYVETALFVVGLLTLWMAGRIYKRLIRETDSMGASDHRLIKYIKLKVTSYFKIGMHPEDTHALIGRYIKKYRIGLFTLNGWTQLPYLFMTAMLSVGGGNFMYRWTSGENIIRAVTPFGVSIVGAGILYGLMRFMDFNSKEAIITQSMADYIGNYLNHKLAYEYKNQAGKVPPEQYKRALQEIAATSSGRHKERKAKYYYDEYEDDTSMSRNDEVDAKIVEDVLKEFLC